MMTNDYSYDDYYYYYNQSEPSISGDDINRRKRERGLGLSEPSADWKDCHKPIRCLWPNQTIRVKHPMFDKKNVYHYHNLPGLIKVELILV